MTGSVSRKIVSRQITFLFTISLFANSPLFAEGVGVEGAEFLRSGAAGRQASMGDAAVGLADDANAALWNPAAWGLLRRHELSVVRTEWLEGIDYTGALYGHSTDALGSWGVGFLSLNVPDFQGYDELGATTRMIRASDRLFLAGHGLAWRRFAVGANVKYVAQTIDGKSAGAWAADAGFHGKLPVGGGAQKLGFGLSARNLGGKLKFDDEPAALPRFVEAGLAYQAFNETLNVAADVSFSKNEPASGRLGLEYWVKNLLAFRLGYRPDPDLGNGLSFGFGAHVKTVFVDYAFADFGRLEETHRVSLRVRFGGKAAKVQREAARLAREKRYVQAIGQLDYVLDYEPHNAQALSQLRAYNQMHRFSQAEAVPPPADSFGQAVELYEANRFLSALDKFVAALSERPEKEEEIHRYIAAIGEKMHGEQALSAREHREIRRLLTSPDSPAGGSETEMLKDARRLQKRRKFLAANEAAERLDATTTDPDVRREAKRIRNEILDTMTREARGPRRTRERVYATAFLLYSDKHHDQAAARWRKILKVDPGNEEVRRYLEAAERNKTEVLRKEQIEHLMKAARTHQEMGKFHLAEDRWLEAYALDPGELSVRASLAERASRRYESGDWEGAVTLLEGMDRIRPLEPEMADLLEQARRRRDLRLHAGPSQRRTAAPPPAARKPDAPAAPATAPETEAVPAEPAARDSASAMALYQEGLIAFSQKNFDEAIRLWSESLELDPANEKVKKALDRAYREKSGASPANP